MELDKKVELFREVFVHRNDVFTVQKSNGDYHKVENKLTDQDIKDHFKGRHTIGCYQLKEEEDGTATAKWGCLDIDLHATIYKVPSFDIEEWNDKLDKQVEIAKLQLAQHNLPFYVEDSGQKGRHVWLFFEKPLDAITVKRSMEMLFRKMPSVDEGNIVWEIFPKQTRIQHAYGNLVKMPFSIHQKTKRPSVFHGELDKIKFVTRDQLELVQSPYEAVFHNCDAFRDMKNIAMVTNHLNHQQRLVLAYLFWNLPNDVFDYDAHEGAKFIENKIYSKLSDYDPAYVRKEFNFHKSEKTDKDGNPKKGYAPPTCKFLQSEDCGTICSGTCQAIGKGKSPISFYYRSLGQETPESIIEKESPKDFRPDLYYIDDFKYYQKVAPKRTKEGSMKKSPDITISNFIVKLNKELTYDDGIDQNKIFEGSILSNDIGGFPIPFRISAKHYANEKDFREALYNTLGAKIYIENDRKLKEAVYKFTNTEKISVLKIFGYNNDKTVYLSPSVKVTRDGVFDNSDTIVHLDGERAEVLDLSLISDLDFENLKIHIRDELLNVLEWHVTHTSFGHVMLPVIGAFLEDSADLNRYAFLLRGLSGSGKSHLMKAMQHFYSPKFGPPVTWTSTHNAIQKMGFYFKDAMFLVDDLKKKNIERNYNGVLAMLQNYADGTTRDRMRQDTEMQRSWPIRGWLTLTGEDNIEHEASNLARMITVRTTNKIKKLEIGDSIENWMKVYSAYTARYIHHILNTDKVEIKNKFLNYKNSVFYPMVAGFGNDVRMSQNIAQLMTSYEYAIKFLYSDDLGVAEEHIKTMKGVLSGLIESLIKEVGEEAPGQIFWETLLDLIGRNKVFIQDGNTIPDEKPNYNSELIGFKGARDNKIYLLSSFYDTVQKYLKQIDRKIGHSKKAVIDELVDRGTLESAKSEVRGLNGKTQRVYVVMDNALDLL